MMPNRPAVIAALATVALFSGCRATDARLIGKWRSNGPLSVPTFPHRQQLTAEKRAFLDGMFGRLTVTYSERYCESELPPKHDEEPSRQRIVYRVIASDADSVTIELKDAPTGHDITNLIHFVGPNRYWISVGDRGGREYFDRLSE